MTQFNYGTGKLTSGIAIKLLNGSIKGSLPPQTIQAIKASQQYVQEIVNTNKTVYGINTGFGILANTKISEEDTQTLQYKILQSHSVGVGEAAPHDIAKLMLLTK